MKKTCKKSYLTLAITDAELEKISYLKIHTEAKTKTAILRKGLYNLYEQIKQRENSRQLEPSPVEG